MNHDQPRSRPGEWLVLIFHGTLSELRHKRVTVLLRKASSRFLVLRFWAKVRFVFDTTHPQ
jgi:hypothetical protein